MKISTTFFNFYMKKLNEDTTSAAFGANAALYSNLGEPTSDTYVPGDARMPKVLGSKKRITRRTFPETVFLTGKQKAKKKSKK